MLGKNYYERYTETVNSDSTYKKEIASTEDFASGQYFIVVQHPMYNNVLDITIEASDAGDGVKNEVTGGYNILSYLVLMLFRELMLQQRL